MTRRATAKALCLAVVLAVGCRDGSGQDIAAAVAAVEGMDAVPSSADVVLGAEIGPLSRSALIDRAVTRMLMADPGLQADLQKLLEGCGFDPVRDLTTVLAAMDTGQEGAASERALLVATGKLSEGKLASCVGKHMQQLGGSLVQKSVNGRVEYQADSPPGRLDVWLAFGSPRTVVVSSSQEFLAEALGDGPRLASDRQMAELVHRARVAGAAVWWAAGKVSAEVGKGLAAATQGKIGAPRALFGHLAAETGLSFELGVELASPEEAKAALSLATNELRVLTNVAQKWRLGRAVAKVAPEAVGTTVFLRAKLTDEELRQALAPIDTDAGPDQNPAPPEGSEGAESDGKGDASPGGEAPVRQQGQAD
jgi:hypothetical protein